MFVRTSNKRGCTSCACSNYDGSAHARYLSSRFLVYSSRCCCCCRWSRCVPRFEVNNLRSFSSSQTRLAAASSLSRSEGFLCRLSRLFPLQQTTSTSRPVKRSRVSSLSLYVQPRRQQGRANLVSSADASLSLNVSDAFAAGAASASTIPRHRPRPLARSAPLLTLLSSLFKMLMLFHARPRTTTSQRRSSTPPQPHPHSTLSVASSSFVESLLYCSK